MGDFQAGNCPDTLLDTVSHVPSIDSVATVQLLTLTGSRSTTLYSAAGQNGRPSEDWSQDTSAYTIPTCSG